jgi:hypothetical protein
MQIDNTPEAYVENATSERAFEIAADRRVGRQTADLQTGTRGFALSSRLEANDVLGVDSAESVAGIYNQRGLRDETTVIDTLVIRHHDTTVRLRDRIGHVFREQSLVLDTN